MQVDLSGGPAVKVWARTPVPALIETILKNLSKKEPDGTVETDVDLFELFPVLEFLFLGLQI